MSDFRVASRYAKSIIELSKEKNTLEQVATDMQLFLQVLKENRSLETLLFNPVVKSDKKSSVLTAIFGKHFQELTKAFFDIIVRKGRESMLGPIAEQFMAQYNELKGIDHATVTTASPLSESALASIRQSIEAQTGKKVEITTKVDPNVIGGFVIRLKDRLFDASIAKKIQNLKQELA